MAAKFDLVAYKLSSSGLPEGPRLMVRPAFKYKAVADQYRAQLEREERFSGQKLVVEMRKS